MSQKTPVNRNVSFSLAKNLPSIATVIFDEEKHALQSKWQFFACPFILLLFFFLVVGERVRPNEEGYTLLHFIMKNNNQISDRRRRNNSARSCSLVNPLGLPLGLPLGSLWSRTWYNSVDFG